MTDKKTDVSNQLIEARIVILRLSKSYAELRNAIGQAHPDWLRAWDAAKRVT